MDQEGFVMNASVSQPVLSARNLVKRYGRVVAMDRADFDLYPNEILAV
ncbi:MAG: sugar ABC transporter ATP-binding protein, partial [Alphaproteobacteria bacterium]|nr:sugar ABC transporter ATP-binding protein [Alphaproteobacteria bacterium]